MEKSTSSVMNPALNWRLCSKAGWILFVFILLTPFENEISWISGNSEKSSIKMTGCWARTLQDVLTKKSRCAHLQNEGLHAILDQVCEVCFSLFRFMDPDIGAKCKNGCFKNQYYQWCTASLSNNELPYPDEVE